MKLVIVESPAKAKSIEKYLGPNYKVLASYGHVRDLPSKNHSVRPDEDFALTWEVIDKAERALKDIRAAMKNADELILATDPDREGEAISWHVLEYLKSINLLGKVSVSRVAFNAITKSAVLEAMKSPRDINQELVEAYLARLSLDYLVGFTLSPILWRKLPGSRSAGRVQSVSLRLVVEREREIEVFKTQEYWTIEGQFGPSSKAFFTARLTHLKGKKLEKFSLQKEAEAKAAVVEALKWAYHVSSIEKKRVKRNPQPPFTTSTLQQEASRKLGLGASKTMQIAQKLYEGMDLGNGETTGLITYMRTDSVQIIPEAIKECQDHIRQEFGASYLPPAVRVYKTKAKNAQEAHEAIRPTAFAHRPQDVKHVLDSLQFRLYDLIWKRAVASQMASAEFDQVGVDIAAEKAQIIFRATGSTLFFDGFLKLYQESTDETEGARDEGEERTLPPLEKDQPLVCKEILPHQHFTQPPPRYTEASLVKKMEELGIGRPSTYARILQVLQDRDYVTVEKKQMVPQERGRIVTAFLTHFFERYVQYGFTADLENQLDDISAGSLPWKKVLHTFWETFHQTVKESQNLTISQVLETLEKDLSAYLFPENEGNDTTPPCARCGTGKLGLRLGKFGAFIGCSNYPECTFTRPLQSGGELPAAGDVAEAAAGSAFPRILGTDPQSNLTVSLRLGPYGPYFQWGDDPKPKRVSLPKGTPMEAATLERALEMGRLPRDIGIHPETGEKITASLGRFGPYVKHKDRFISLKKDDDLLTITLERAVELIDKAPPKAARFTPPPKKTKKVVEKKPRAPRKKSPGVTLS